MSTITGISADVLVSYYSSRNLTTNTSTQTSTTREAVWSTDGILTPWDTDAEQTSDEDKLTEVLKGGSLVDEAAAKLSNPDASETEQQLFALYSALNTLSSIASYASDKETPDILLTSLNSRFHEALDEILAYGNTIGSDDMSVIAGDKNTYVTSETTVPRTLSQYTTDIIHRNDITQRIDGLDGTEVFTIDVAKSSGDLSVEVDLSELGTSDVLMDDLINLINTKLEEAGSVSRFSRERIIEETGDDDDDDGTLPQTWALSIEGTSTEKLSFSAATSGTAVYLAGASGKSSETAGQFLKLDASDESAVEITGADRLEADTENEESATSNAIALDSQGNSYVVSTTESDVGDLNNQGTKDVVLTKYDSTGNVVWQQMLGSSDAAEGFSVAVDADDNVIIAGKATGDLSGGDATSSHNDAFVTKYDSSGAEQFTRHLGPYSDDGALAVTTDSDGNIYFAGYTKGAIDASVTFAGGEDAFITKLDASGSLQYSRQFGTSGDERITDIEIDDSGNLIALSEEDGHAVVRAFDAGDGTSGEIWSQDLGDLSNTGSAAALTVSDGTVYVAGSTDNASFGGGTILQGHNGATDGFIVQLDGSSGAINSTAFVGTESTDRIRDIDVVGGEIYITGDTTGALGESFSGSINAFAAKVGTDGSLDWTYQYAGRNGEGRAYGIAVDDSGSSVLDVLGLPKGELTYAEDRSITTQSTVRDGDYFYIQVDGGSKRKVTIELGDSINDLKRRINNILVLDGEASSTSKDTGSALKIEAAEGHRIDIYAGEGARDALAGLGLEPSTLIGRSTGSDDDDSQEKVYVALGLSDNLSLLSKEDAATAAQELQSALSVIRNGYRSLTTPSTDDDNQSGGAVSSYLTSQLANYQAGLARLSSGDTSTTTLLL